MVKTNQSDVKSARQVVYPVLNTSYKLKTAKRHYTASCKSHRAAEIAALRQVLDRIEQGSRNRDTRRTNVVEVKRAVKSILRALNIKVDL